MKKQVLAILLAMLLVVPMLSACQSNDDTADTTADTSAQTAEQTTAQTEEENEFAEVDAYIDSLASQYNFDGATFTIIGRTDEIMPGDRDEIEASGGVWTVENQAMHERITQIEQAFSVDFEYIVSDAGGDTADAVTAAQMAGLLDYDLAEAHLVNGGKVMFNNGVLQDAAKYSDILQFDESYWLEDIVNTLGIDGKLYFLTGKISPSVFDAPGCVLVNKDLATNLGLDMDEIYQTVIDGDWTFDAMIETTSAINTESGIKRYHIGTDHSLGMCAFYAGGFRLSTSDEDGNTVIADHLSEDAVTWLQKLNSEFGDIGKAYSGRMQQEGLYSIPELDDYSGTELLARAKCLYMYTVLGEVNYLALYGADEGISFNYGILPMPKSSTDQEEYIGFMGAQNTRGVYFPKNLENATMTAVITEAMAALSEKYMEPTYLDQVLMGRGSSDLASRQIVQTIYNSSSIDIVDTFEFGQEWTEEDHDGWLAYAINSTVTGVIDHIVSEYDESVGLIRQQIEDLCEFAEENEKN